MRSTNTDTDETSWCLLDNSAPRGPPDVPPRNPTMSRVNGRLPGSHAASDHERDPDLQPSCLVRTSSGGFYSIPKIPKNEYNNKNQSTGNSPIKVELQNNMDRVPLPYGHASSMIPMRRQSIRCHFVKGVDWCSWKLIAMILLMVSLCITAALAYVVVSSIVNRSYQGTKACAVLVSESTDTKALSSDGNKTSSSASASSSQSSGRTRQQASSGGSMKASASMLEHAYRKRRDTYNKHALHQTVPSREQADEPPSTGVAGGEGAATSPRSPEAERSAPFTDDRPRGVVVVHDKEHAGPNSSPTSSSLSSPSSSSSMSSSTSSTPAGTHLLLDVSRSSTANNHYSHDPSSATPSTLRPSSPINPTTDPSSYSPSPSSSSSSSSFSSSSSVSFTDESQPPPSKNHLANDLTPRSSIIDEQIADSSYVPRTTTESGTGIPGAYAGVAFPEVGSNGFRGEEVESITIAKQEDDGTVSGVEVEVESRVEGGGGTTASIAYDHQRNVSSKDAKDAVALVVVGEHEVDAAPPGRAWTKSLEEVKKKRKEEEEEEEGGREGVESGPRDTARNSSSDFSGVVKETRELSREDSSSSEEDVGWPSRAKSYEKSEELLQRDYPSPIYNYNGQDEVEFVKLNHGNETTTGKSNDNDNDDDEDDVVDEDDGDDNDDDRGPISFGDDEVKTNDVPPSIGDLRVITREESDEEFLREFERKFHEEADSPAARGREGGEGASIESNSAESRNPPTQQVKIIEVPVDRSRRPSTSSSTPSSPNRVLVNITIASGDSASAASRPLYVLSVSVPTGGDGVADGEERDGGTRGREEEREGASERVHRAGPARRQEASSQMAEIASPVEGNDNRLPPPPQPPSSPPPPMWAGGECECSCPCMGSSSDEWDNDFSPVDETMSLEGPREGQSRNTSESVDEPDVVRTVAADTRQVETREEGNSVSSVSLEETVKGETSSQHDYFSGTEENSSTIDWTTSNYGSESSGVGVSGCSGATPLPPEPTILILEGARTFPARSFPPDGTTFAQVGLGQKLSKEIPPYS